MNKRKISEEVYDRYVDASVALFMEYYAASCLDESDSPQIDKVEFPADLDSRCRTLIDREFARQRRKAFFRVAAKGLGVVACVAAFILSLSSVLFMTVEAVRVPIINYYIKQEDGYWEISSGSNDSTEMYSNNVLDLSDPLDGIIPEKYVPVSVTGYSLEWLTVLYQCEDGHGLQFSSGKSDKVLKVDSEDVQFSQKIQILGNEAIIVIREDAVHLAWVCESIDTTFTLFSTEYRETEIIELAEKFTNLIYNQ